MTVKTEGQHKGEFLVSEANGTLSRETGTVLSGEVLVDGSVVYTSGGKLKASVGNAGSETIVGISYGDYDATGGDVTGAVYIARYAEVKADLVYIDATNDAAADDSDTVAELKTLGIVLR